MNRNGDKDVEVLIAGAGPVGLFLAYLLGRQGVRCLLVERRREPVRHSRAIGVMPPTLALFRAVGLAETMIAAGSRVQRAVVHDVKRELGCLDFHNLPPPFPFVLSLPQNMLMQTLERAANSLQQVSYSPGTSLSAIRQDADGVIAEIVENGGNNTLPVRAGFLAACDGAGGSLRRLLQVDAPTIPYRPSFLMGDYVDRTGWGDEAHLFFTPAGSVESFPMPEQMRRWVVLADPAASDRQPRELRRRILQLTGTELQAEDQRWHSDFIPQYRLNRRYVNGRAVCCGDSAHVMSPIGGQGMNTGLADAWHLANALEQSLRGGLPHAPLLAHYEKCRRQAFKTAARRAAMGMWLGTRTGRVSSALRSAFIRHILFINPMRRRLAPFFAMMTIPGYDAIKRESVGKDDDS